MFKLIYTNSAGESIELFGRPYRLTSVEGLGDVEADVQTQKAPYQDGESLIDTVLEPRYMSVELKIVGDDLSDIERKRRHLAKVFNPKLQLGTLKYIRGDMVRQIKVVAESVPSFPDGSTNRGRTFQKALIFLRAPNPYWQSTRVTEEPAFEPRFRFPIRGPFIMGVQRTDRLIFNDGDAPAPLQVDFYGPADSPYIENKTTGEFIKINKRLEEGEMLKIDTSNASVIFVSSDGEETNVFNWLDLGSTFFELQVGENDITCRCAISNNMKDFDIYYNKFYTAV